MRNGKVLDKRVRVGTSGWIYKHWKGVFYPRGLPAARHLEFYAQHFDTVEVNYSFYRLPGRDVFARWASRTPAGFVFAVKASRYLTHRKKLKDPAEPVHRLIEAAEGLGEKLGPILFQLPPDWSKNFERLDGLLQQLPPTHRYAFEFRHPSWLTADVFGALERHGCALCIPDHPDMPKEMRVTADFTYLRFHSGRHGANYQTGELAAWAGQLRRFLDAGVSVYAYFNNDVGGFALRNAVQLLALMRRAA